MANFGAKILNNSVSSLQAQQAAIATISNNIANVNTPGYVRRQAQLETRSQGGGNGLDVGSGVQVGDVQRIADNFLESLMQGAQGTKSQEQVKNDYLTRVESLFALDGSQVTIGSALNDFYSAMNQVALSPANLELRSNLIQRGQDLASVINNTYNTVAQVQTELDARLGDEIGTVNSLTAQIADLNTKVAQREASGATAGDERDKRDVLLNQLAEKISFQKVETDNGSVNIFLENGFALVNGSTSRSLSVTTNPSFQTAGVPPSLGGGALSYVVYDYGTTGAPSHLDLTPYLKSGSGTIGGILQVRGYNSVNNTSAFSADGPLVAVASRVEALARQLLTNVNSTYLGSDEDGNAANGHQPSSADLNGTVPNAYGLFGTSLHTSSALDVDGDGRPEISDLTSASLGRDNFASILQFKVATPSNFAAARDADTTAGSTVFPKGDGANAQALAALRTQTFTFSTGSYSATATMEDQYNETVSYIGNAKSSAALNLKVAEANYTTAANHRDEVSGVSLDEEFTGLIKFQKAYQASARMIKVAQDLLDQVTGLL